MMNLKYTLLASTGFLSCYNKLHNAMLINKQCFVSQKKRIYEGYRFYDHGKKDEFH